MDTEISISQNNPNNSTFLVYKHTNLSNGKVYIGITNRNPEKRWSKGNAYKSNQHFTNAIKKYGWEGFSHEIIKEGLTKEEALLLEESLIKEYDSTNSEKGYNILKSSVSNYPWFTDSSKIKMSESRKKYFENMSDEDYEAYCKKCKEVSNNEEYKFKISRKMKDYYSNPENRKKLSDKLKEKYSSYSDKEKEKLRSKSKESMNNIEVRKKISDSLKDYYKGLSEEELQELKERTRTSLSRPEVRKKMSESQKRYVESLTEEERQYRKDIAKKSSNRPEVKEKSRESLKKYRENLTEERKEELRQISIKTHSSEEYREKASEAAKRAYENDPNLKNIISEKTKEAMNRPDVRKKLLESINSPEYLSKKKKLKEDFEKQKLELYPNHIKWNQFQKIWFEQNNKG